MVKNLTLDESIRVKVLNSTHADSFFPVFPFRAHLFSAPGGFREKLYAQIIVFLSQPFVAPLLPWSLTYLGSYVTDDWKVSRNWHIVPRYRQSHAQTRDSATASSVLC